MPIALAVFLPGEQKPPRDEFLEDLLQPFKGEIFANRRHPSPDHAQIGDFEAAARVSQAVEPGVFALRPLRARGQLVAGPQGIEINHAFRHFALRFSTLQEMALSSRKSRALFWKPRK